MEPILSRLEKITGKGGTMGYNSHYDSLSRNESNPTAKYSDEEDFSDLYSGKNSPQKRESKNNLEMTLAKGQMSPIEEESGLITDSMSSTSAFSTNSRNFQMPEKDFIQEISKQRD